MNRFYEPVNGFTHLAGALLAVAGLAWLLALAWHDAGKALSVAVYGASMVLLYATSATMHLVTGPERLRQALVRCDHAAIYVLIAGSYTPFCYNLLDEPWRSGMLGAVWAVAVLGLVLRLFVVRGYGHLSTVLYVLMGWSAVLVAPVALRELPPGALGLILAGGIVYTVGALVYATNRPRFHRHFGAHELWHLFVLGGSALHFAAVLLYVV